MTDAATDVDPYAGTVSRLNEGKIVSIADLVSEVAPPPSVPSAPTSLPLPAVITDVQRQALERLPEVFGSVVPTERRALTAEESAALREERDVVDDVLKMVSSRKDDITVTVNNHIDCLLEDEGVPDDVVVNDKGHYVAAKRVAAGDGKVWSREVRRPASTIDPAVLRDLAEDPEVPEFTHQDYLAMTEQVRVIEENRFMLHLKKNPHLLEVVARASSTPPPTASIYLRNAKPGEG